MLVNLTKFIHLLCVLGLLSCMFFCMRLISASKVVYSPQPTLNKLNTFILWLSLVAMISGTLLIYPKHFTFHTPWIQAAYLFLVLFCSGILLLKKITLTRKSSFVIYLLLFFILIGVMHDAVTKTTLLVIPHSF